MFGLPNIDLLVALQRNYNNWMYSQQVASKGRLVGLAALPVQQPERAHEELARIIKMGMKGIVIPPTRPEAEDIAMMFMSLRGPGGRSWAANSLSCRMHVSCAGLVESKLNS